MNIRKMTIWDYDQVFKLWNDTKGVGMRSKDDSNKVALVAFNTNQIGNTFWESVGFEKRDDLIYRNLSLDVDNI